MPRPAESFTQQLADNCRSLASSKSIRAIGVLAVAGSIIGGRGEGLSENQNYDTKLKAAPLLPQVRQAATYEAAGPALAAFAAVNVRVNDEASLVAACTIKSVRDHQTLIRGNSTLTRIDYDLPKLSRCLADGVTVGPRPASAAMTTAAYAGGTALALTAGFLLLAGIGPAARQVARKRGFPASPV